MAPSSQGVEPPINPGRFRPFGGDIEKTRDHVLAKAWTPDELSQVRATPSILAIGVDFDEFSPRTHPWVLLHFGRSKVDHHQGRVLVDETLRQIAEIVNEANSSSEDLFALAKSFSKDRADLTKVFRAQPGAFGFSIDIIAAGNEFKAWLESRKHR